MTQYPITPRKRVDDVPPSKRKAILILSPHDLTRLEYEPQGNELLLNEQIYLLVSDVPDSPLKSKLENNGLLELGNLLIQSPYDTSDYALLDKVSSVFTLAKYLHFITLCGLLGAREVTVEQVEVKTSKGKQVFKGDVNSLYAKGNLEGESKIFEEIRNNISSKSRFNGAQPDLEKAEAHLRQYNLLNDTSMKSLIDQRRGSNPIKSRELNLSLSEESKKSLKIISDVKIPIYVDLQAQIDQVKKEIYEFTLKIKVEF